MPAIATRVLTNATAVSKNFTPNNIVGFKSVFVEETETRIANRPVLSETTRPTASNNVGHKVSVTLALPHPVTDAGASDAVKDLPPTSYFNIETLAHKYSTSAQQDDLLAFFKSYVNSAAFAALVKGGNNF